MALIKQLVTQSGSDTATEVEILTGLTSDGKSGWAIKSIRAVWKDIAAVAAGDYSLLAAVNTESGAYTEVDDENLLAVRWAAQNTGGVAVFASVEQVMESYSIEERVTVQPALYFRVESSGTSQANDVIFLVQYEPVKLSDTEVLRLLVGGA